jgi:sugar-specific transcriptional regulator TrmB
VLHISIKQRWFNERKLNGKEIVEMLRDFSLGESEARAYFALLTIGEAKVGLLAKKAYVPQSARAKSYEIIA